MRTKLKAKKSLIDSLKKQIERRDYIEVEINELKNEIDEIKSNIKLLSKDLKANNNIEYIKSLDKNKNAFEVEILNLNKVKEWIEKKEVLSEEFEKSRQELELIKADMDIAFAEANKDMIEKTIKFGSTYYEFMSKADNQCRSTYIGQDYMPVVNNGKYRERSAHVSKRLMYFLTFLYQSINFRYKISKIIIDRYT